jgi:8-oxo-dGTP diphosphatase
VHAVSDERLLRELSVAGAFLTPMPLVIEVTAALIQDAAGRYLITQRRRGSHLEGLWEFPGGKRDVGETLETCLARELTEELGASFTIGDLVDTVRWEYPDRTVVIHFYRCRLASGTIAPQESQAMAWVASADLTRYEFPPADRELIARLAGR